MTTSLEVARIFRKEHSNVLRAIRNSDIPPRFSELNFESVDIIEENASNLMINKSNYRITRDGFMILMIETSGALHFLGHDSGKGREPISSPRASQEAGL